MAKKKVTFAAKDSNQEAPPQENQEPDKTANLTCPVCGEDTAEKLQNLKALNSLLLKEASEKRQHIKRLVQAKEILDGEVKLFGMDKNVLETQLTRASDENVALELEKKLILAVMYAQMREMCTGIDGLVTEKSDRETEIAFLKNEVNRLMGDLQIEKFQLNRVCQERDSANSDLSLQAKEANELRKKVTGMEEKETALEVDIGKLKLENAGLIEEKENGDIMIKMMVREKDKLENKLQEKMEETEDLKREIEVIVKEKEEILMEKSAQKEKLNESIEQLKKLNEILLNLRKEEEMWREKVLELEKSFGEAMEKGKEMATEISALLAEKRDKEGNIESLMEQKDSIAKQLEMTMMESKKKEDLLEELSREKNESEELKVSQEKQLVELHKELDELRNVAIILQDSSRDLEEKNKQLLFEVGNLRDSVDRLTFERDNTLKCFEEEIKNRLNLKSKASELAQLVEETRKQLMQIKAEHESLIGEKKEMENHFETLKKEKDTVQKDLAEAKRAIDDLRAELESAGINSQRALTMLKNTAALVSQSNGDSDAKDDMLISEEEHEHELEPYAAELLAIRKALRNKETMVDDMKRQVEYLQNSVAEAHKKKSFWTLLSSATTIFAAASFAYAARAR